MMSKTLDKRDYLAVFEQSSNPACILEPIRRDGRLVDLRLLRHNAAFVRMYDPKKSLIGDGGLLSVGGYADCTSVLRVSRLVLKQGKPRTLRLYLAGPGQWRHCTFARSESGNIVAIFTEIEEGTRPGGIKPATPTIGDFFESGGIKLILRASNGEVLECNRAACAFYGWSPEEFRQKSIFQISQSPQGIISTRKQAIETKGLLIFTTRHRAAGGEIKTVEVHSYYGLYHGDKVHFSFVIDRQGEACEEVPQTDPSERVGHIGRGDFHPFIKKYEARIPFIRELVRQVFPYGKLIKYKRGEHFLEYGDVNPNAGFVLKGLFRQYTISPGGADYTLNLIRAGEILYVSRAEAEGSSINLALQAMDDCLVFVIESRHFGPVIDGDLRWSKLFYRIGDESVNRHLKREYSLLCEDASERYARFLREDGDAAPHLHSYDVASYLGITSETLSRIKKTVGKFRSGSGSTGSGD
jgi:PAS domain-containing protein/CRP-like cAMP-binding protein